MIATCPLPSRSACPLSAHEVARLTDGFAVAIARPTHVVCAHRHDHEQHHHACTLYSQHSLDAPPSLSITLRPSTTQYTAPLRPSTTLQTAHSTPPHVALLLASPPPNVKHAPIVLYTCHCASAIQHACTKARAGDLSPLVMTSGGRPGIGLRTCVM
ncbi:hypothetical protein HGRIS_000812 [Hohenbuehelia grisea]|uniref:Uncharacterized protein n=1 Tax=Hohenbuehelia grisea TaxID=104357 RepID=A0ABR3IPU4_9AGAR